MQTDMSLAERFAQMFGRCAERKTGEELRITRESELLPRRRTSLAVDEETSIAMEALHKTKARSFRGNATASNE